MDSKKRARLLRIIESMEKDGAKVKELLRYLDHGDEYDSLFWTFDNMLTTLATARVELEGEEVPETN